MSNGDSCAPVMKERRRHLPVLDGVRGLAIALVVVHHAFMAGAPALTGFDSAAFRIAGAGWCGVDLFFVLSGFLITGVLLDSRGSQNFFKNFYARRTLRIFPLYFAVLFGVFVVAPSLQIAMLGDYVADSVGDQGWFWAHLTNISIVARGGFYDYLVPNVFWSLAVEEQFYLAWPLVVWKCGERALVKLCVIGSVCALLFRAGLLSMGSPAVATFVLTPARLDALLLGSLVALVLRSPAAGHTLARWWRPAALLGGAGVALSAVTTGALDWNEPMVATLGFTGMAMLFAGGIAGLITMPRDNRLVTLLSAAPLRSLGKVSYAVYLFHGPVGSVIQRFYDPATAGRIMGSNVPATTIYTLLMFAVSFALGHVSWRLLENPVLALKRRFSDGPAVAPLQLAGNTGG